jgi:hypothetical protein
MIVYEYADGNRQPVGGHVWLHRAEGEMAPVPEHYRGAEVDRRKRIKDGNWKRTCDGTPVAKGHIKHDDVAKVPQWVTACTRCFRGHYDELLPLYRRIPIGSFGTEGTDE